MELLDWKTQQNRDVNAPQTDTQQNSYQNTSKVVFVGVGKSVLKRIWTGKAPIIAKSILNESDRQEDLVCTASTVHACS